MYDLLARLMGMPDQPFALLHRPSIDPDAVDVYRLKRGQARNIEAATVGGDRFVVLPFAQVRERGFEAVDESLPIHALPILEHERLLRSDVVTRLPSDVVRVDSRRFNLDDEAFAARVQRVIETEIGRGAGSNFVLHRKMLLNIVDFQPIHRFALFRKLLEIKASAYWVFAIHSGVETFIGLSPELHAGLVDGEVTMNPISGTYLYPEGGPTLDTLLAFLDNRKEANELFMVVDEELKMLSRLCQHGASAEGPRLKFLDHVAHTEYMLRGRTDADVAEVLRQTVHAPTVTGSPMQSACSVIARHEPEGRRYYSGVLGLIERGKVGTRLDSAIAIRTAEIDAQGRVTIGVGATIVRDSDPQGEADETRMKARTLLTAFEPWEGERFERRKEVEEALRTRASLASDFWCAAPRERMKPHPSLEGRRVLILDGRDDFTAMIETMMRAAGAKAHVARVWSEDDLREATLVVAGPGPGDPTDVTDPRIAALRGTIEWLLSAERPFLAVCLSHQILCCLLNLPMEKLQTPNQGVQKQVNLFGRSEKVGFYNTFCAKANTAAKTRLRSRGIAVTDDPEDASVISLIGPTFSSVQFHLESFLTKNGPGILEQLIAPIVLPQQQITVRTLLGDPKCFPIPF